MQKHSFLNSLVKYRRADVKYSRWTTFIFKDFIPAEWRYNNWLHNYVLQDFRNRTIIIVKKINNQETVKKQLSKMTMNSNLSWENP